MRLRVHIEFLGLDQVKITKFSRTRTIDVKDLEGRLFDFDSFKFVNSRDDSDFYLSHWDGEGTISDPYELSIHKRNYDTGSMETVGLVCAKGPREVVVEETLMPESLRK